MVKNKSAHVDAQLLLMVKRKLQPPLRTLQPLMNNLHKLMTKLQPPKLILLQPKQ